MRLTLLSSPLPQVMDALSHTTVSALVLNNAVMGITVSFFLRHLDSGKSQKALAGRFHVVPLFISMPLTRSFERAD